MNNQTDNQAESAHYTALGVSAAKEDVHRAVQLLPAELFPGSFCRIAPDIFNQDPEYCVVSHADGAGTKSILACVHFGLHHEAAVFRGVAQDAIVMNLDDLLCVGATGNVAVTSIVNRNNALVSAEVLEAIIGGTQQFIERMAQFGVLLHYCGGETADVGDIVRTVLVDSVLTCRMRREFVVDNAIGPNCAIVGLASGGPPAIYEDAWNSGIGSNGITAARHNLLRGETLGASSARFFDNALAPDLIYRGPFAPDDVLPSTVSTVLEALLSPTRTFAPIVAEILRTFRPHVKGLVHCTGGGQLKCLKFGHGIVIDKDLGANVPAVFQAIQRSSGLDWGELAKMFNLGFRMEIYCDEAVAAGIIDISRSFNVEAAILGRTGPSNTAGNVLRLRVHGEDFVFERPLER